MSRLRRLERTVRNARNAVIDHAYSRCRRRRGVELAHALQEAGARRPCFTIAFNTPWVIELLCQSWRRFSPGMQLVVVDNSTRAEARRAHERICAEHGVPYLAMPQNPEWNPSRSHGIAMNWIWRNSISGLATDMFGFIDHDCFPLAPLDLPGRLAGHSVYGFRRDSPSRRGIWNLWAGFCFFNTAAIGGAALDFKPCVELGLDTGGCNWTRLYSTLPSLRVRLASNTRVAVDLGPGLPNIQCRVLERCFLHVGGASYRKVAGKIRNEDVRAAFRRLVLAGAPG